MGEARITGLGQGEAMSEQYDSHVMLYNIVWMLMVEDAMATRCFDPDGKRIDVVRYIEQGTGHEYEFHRSRPRHQEHWEWVVGYCHVQAGLPVTFTEAGQA